MADEVAVMYAGMVVERGPVAELFSNPRHPYTQALQRSIPEPDASGERGILATIPGRVPALTGFPSYCRFSDRCPIVKPECLSAMPAMREVTKGHFVRCDLA